VQAYIVRRLLLGLLIVWGVYTITFLAVNLAPGDPFTAKESAKVTEADLNRQRRKWGYDRSVPERYFLHLRKMFWADPETIQSEGGGLGFEVTGSGDGNRVRAHVQEPPAEIVLVPARESVLDYGSQEVRLVRGADGVWPAQPIRSGKYAFGDRSLSVQQAAVTLDSQGVLLSYADGVVSARASLAAAPEEVVLEPATRGAERVVLARSDHGVYGPAEVVPGRYTHMGGAEVLVPEDPLETGGLTFDLGTSIEHNRSVIAYLKRPLWNTLQLGFWALLVNYAVGIALGVLSAVRRDTPLDHGIMVGAFFLYSMPGFWLGLMLQLVFSVALGWLPIHGMGEGGFWDSVAHFAMPVFTLGVAAAAGTARYQRSAVLEILSEDYVRTARAKGLEEKTVIWKHVIRNALLPIITLFGLSLPFLVSGAVITEEIFSWPGIGRAAIAAISSRDVFVVTAVTLFATIMVVVGNLVADVLYAVADPRVRLK
jgi:peptide/nickel transport system permease protein